MFLLRNGPTPLRAAVLLTDSNSPALSVIHLLFQALV